MPKYKVYARKITDIEIVVTADDPDDAIDVAENIDPDDPRWEVEPGHAVLDTNSNGCGAHLIEDD